MVASSSSNLLLLAATQQHDAGHHHGWTDSTLPTDPDLLHLPTTNRRGHGHGFLIRSNSHNNIRRSTGNLKDLIMLETVCSPPPPPTAGTTVPNKNAMAPPPPPAVIAAAASTSSMKALPPVPFHHDDNNNDDWILGDDEEDDIISTPGRKPRPIRSPQKEEEMLASIGVLKATKMMKDTSIHFSTLENCSSIGSSLSSLSALSSMGGNFKDSMLETTVLSSATISSFRSSTSNSSPVPAPATTPTIRNGTWSTNTSMKGLQSIHRFLSIPLTVPTMPDIFSCTGGVSTGTSITSTTTTTNTTSFNHQKWKKDFTKKKKMSTTSTTSTPIQKKNHHHHHEHDDSVHFHLKRRLKEVKKDLFFQLNLPSSTASPIQKEEDSSSRRTATAAASSKCISPEEQHQIEEENFFEMDTTTTTLSPRIMMLYQDDNDDDDDDDDDDMVMNAPSSASASRVSFFTQPDAVDGTRIHTTSVPAAASNSLLGLTDLALSLATTTTTTTTPVVGRSEDNDSTIEKNDTDDYGIFLSFSDEDDNEEHPYHDGAASSPSFKFNDYAFHNTTTTAPFGVTTVAAAAGCGRGHN